MKLNLKLVIFALFITNLNFSQEKAKDFKSIATFSIFSPTISYAPASASVSLVPQ